MYKILGIIFLAVFSLSLGCQNRSENPAKISAEASKEVPKEADNIPPTRVKDLSPANFETVANNPNTLLLDVRTSEELAETGVIKGAYHLDYNSPDFEKTLEKIAKRDASIAVYCRSGGRSGKTCEALSILHAKEVYNLEGGIENWKKEQRPTVPYVPQKEL